MKRIYHHYTKWEDYKYGLYKLGDFGDEYTKLCLDFFKDLEDLEKTMKKCIDEWKYSREQQMTNTSRNKQAWLGQAACCIKFGVNEDFVKKVWRELNQEEQYQANLIADKIINYFNLTYGENISTK